MTHDDTIFDKFESQPPKLEELNTLLAHPDNDHFNSWIDQGAYRLNLKFEDELKQMKIGPLFDEGGQSEVSESED